MDSITRLARRYCISMPKAKSILIAAGYLREDKTVDPARIADGTCQLRVTEDKYNGAGMITFPVWDPEKVAHLFKEPDEKARAIHFTNRFRCEDKVLEAICFLAESATMSKASNSLKRIVEECRYHDPHFYGGPGAFHYATTKEDIEAIFDDVDDVIAELSEIVRSKKAKALAKAVAKAGREWMLKQVSGR